MKKKTIKRLKESFGKLKTESFQFELIESYFRNKDNSNSFQKISDRTWQDLDFDELFMFLDRTNSSVGQQYLYSQLRNIPANSDRQQLRELVIKRFTEDTGFRIEIQGQLEKLKKENAYYISSLFQEEHIKPPKWYFIVPLLSFTNLLLLILLPFYSQMLFVLLGVFIVNLGIHYWNKNNLNQYLGSIPQLLRLNAIAQKLYKIDSFKKFSPKLPESLRIINQVRNRMSFFQLEAKLQGDLEALIWALLEFVKITFLLEPLLLFGVLKQLDKKRENIETVFSFIGEIDLSLSVASLRAGVDNHCLPSINESGFAIIEIYHPLIVDCVPNSIDVDDKSILLTGSNMSGKTTFIRSVGINIITGLTINTCFGAAMSIPRVRVHSAIRISDDLMNDKSYYFEEVSTIRKFINASGNGQPNLFLLDEIFKGTNTVERIAAGKAVLSALASKDNTVFVSTHDIELTDLLCNEYELHHFSEIVSEGNIDFDYKLKEGKLKNRNAIRILQLNNYPDEVISEAKELSKILDKASMGN